MDPHLCFTRCIISVWLGGGRAPWDGRLISHVTCYMYLIFVCIVFSDWVFGVWAWVHAMILVMDMYVLRHLLLAVLVDGGMSLEKTI